MLVVMKAQATRNKSRRSATISKLWATAPHPMPGAQRTAIGITGNQGEVDRGNFEELVRRRRSHPRLKALQAGQPRRERRRHHHPLPRHRRHHRRTQPRHRRRPLLHREPRTGLRHCRAGRRMPARSSSAAAPTSRAPRPTPSRASASTRSRSWPKSATASGCASSPKPSTTRRSNWSPSGPTWCRSARATCRTSRCSSTPDGCACPSC